MKQSILQLSWWARITTPCAGPGISFVREPKDEIWGTVTVFEDLLGNFWNLFKPT